MNDKMKNELKNEDLEQIAGGTELPTTQAGEDYEGMFTPCDPLRPAPGLPAKELGEYCYSGMFAPCEPIVPGE